MTNIYAKFDLDRLNRTDYFLQTNFGNYMFIWIAIDCDEIFIHSSNTDRPKCVVKSFYQIVYGNHSIGDVIIKCIKMF